MTKYVPNHSEPIQKQASEYEDSHMLSKILERMSAQSMHLKDKIDSGLIIPSWAEYKLYTAYDGLGKALGTAYPGEYLEKEAKTAVKRDPEKWARAKARAKAKMGGKHSARAMQLAVKYYKDDGGTYSGKKPSSSNNSLKKWGKQKWGYTGKDKEGPGGSGVYLPKAKRDRLKSTEEGRKKIRAATTKKHKATREGKQYSSHGLAAGTSLKKTAAGHHRSDILKAFKAEGGALGMPALYKHMKGVDKEHVKMELNKLKKEGIVKVHPHGDLYTVKEGSLRGLSNGFSSLTKQAFLSSLSPEQQSQLVETGAGAVGGGLLGGGLGYLSGSDANEETGQKGTRKRNAMIGGVSGSILGGLGARHLGNTRRAAGLNTYMTGGDQNRAFNQSMDSHSSMLNKAKTDLSAAEEDLAKSQRSASISRDEVDAFLRDKDNRRNLYSSVDMPGTLDAYGTLRDLEHSRRRHEGFVSDAMSNVKKEKQNISDLGFKLKDIARDQGLHQKARGDKFKSTFNPFNLRKIK